MNLQLTPDQIDAVVKWMNTWEQLKDTSIPIRFEEQFSKKAFLTNKAMRFSKVYIQENFIPDIATDPYGRKVIGIEVTLNDDDKIEQAKDLAEQYVKEYIKSNKIESPHIIERYIPEEQLPVIRYD